MAWALLLALLCVVSGAAEEATYREWKASRQAELESLRVSLGS